MELNTIKPPKGATRKRKRLGAGPGSGKGKTSGKGHKGQKSRSGAKIRPWFEGGQMPLQRRLPKVGFTSRNRVEYQIVNLDQIASRSLTGDVTPDALRGAGLIRSLKKPVKVLGRGEIAGAIQLSTHAVSASARDKIAAAGGSVTLIGSPADQA
jgi:large subunit ribosomal protein L15